MRTLRQIRVWMQYHCIIYIYIHKYAMKKVSDGNALSSYAMPRWIFCRKIKKLQKYSLYGVVSYQCVQTLICSRLTEKHSPKVQKSRFYMEILFCQMFLLMTEKIPPLLNISHILTNLDTRLNIHTNIFVSKSINTIVRKSQSTFFASFQKIVVK